jgi:hypothetical protein
MQISTPSSLSHKGETDFIHQDPKVIPQECTCDAQSPGTRYDKELAEHSKNCRNDYVEWGREERVGWLFFQGDCITEGDMSDKNRTMVIVKNVCKHSQRVPDHTERENCDSKNVAPSVHVPANYLRDRLVSVLFTSENCQQTRSGSKTRSTCVSGERTILRDYIPEKRIETYCRY